jgi:hypothetical protein
MPQGVRRIPAVRLAFLLLIEGLALGPAPGPSAPPPLTDDRLGILTAPLLLLSRPDVRAEIGLNAAQSADADKTLSELYQHALALKGQHGPDVENRKRAIDQAGEQWLQSKLSDAQRKRFSQIELQWEGPSALIHRPIIADGLGLSPEQRARLSEAIAARNRRRDVGADRWECERQLFEQTRALLTVEQGRRWRAMLGPPFAFTRQADSNSRPPSSP